MRGPGGAHRSPGGFWPTMLKGTWATQSRRQGQILSSNLSLTESDRLRLNLRFVLGTFWEIVSKSGHDEVTWTSDLKNMGGAGPKPPLPHLHPPTLARCLTHCGQNSSEVSEMSLGPLFILVCSSCQHPGLKSGDPGLRRIFLSAFCLLWSVLFFGPS